MKTKIVSFIKEVGVLTIALTLALVANFAYGQWTGPSGSPAAATNVPAPLNVGDDAQIKAGPLTVNGVFEAPTVNSTNINATTVTAPTVKATSISVSSLITSPNVIGINITATGILEAPKVQSNDFCDKDGGNCISHDRLLSVVSACGENLDNTTWTTTTKTVVAEGCKDKTTIRTYACNDTITTKTSESSSEVYNASCRGDL
jgi:hypothetical protein